MSEINIIPKSIVNLYKFLVLIIFGIMVAGSFSLDRFITENIYLNGETLSVDSYRNTIVVLVTSLPFLTEVRFWLTLLLVLFFIASRHIALTHNVPASVRQWGILVALLHLYMLISIFWAPDTQASAKHVVSLILLSILMLISSTVFSFSFEANVLIFLKLIYWTAIIFSVGGVFGPSTDETRMAAFLGGPNVFVRWMSSGVFCSVYFWLVRRDLRWLAPVPIFLACIVLSGSRGGMISFLLTSIFLLVLLVYYRYLRLGRVVIFLLIFSIFIGVVVQNQRVSEMWTTRFIELTLDSGYLSGRDQFLISAWEMFLDSPFLGVGADGFKQISELSEYPHNILLTFASEGGLVALVLFSVALGKAIVRWFRPKTLLQVFCFIQALFYLIASLFSGYYYDARLMWLFMLLYMMPKLDTGSLFEGATGDWHENLPSRSWEQSGWKGLPSPTR